jgi:hypothetical protein
LHELLPNIIYLERTSDPEIVSRFIRTCDAMLHARDGGETFGLAVAEFAVHNRPVLTSSTNDDNGHGRMHLDVLGAVPALRAFFYHDHESLVRLLRNFDRNRAADYNAYHDFEPHKVMATFEKVFLGARPSHSVLSEDALGIAFAASTEPPHQSAAEMVDAASGHTVVRDAQWVDGCLRGALQMEAHGCLRLPGENAIFLSNCRVPSVALGDGRGELLHVFRSNALATFSESCIKMAISRGELTNAEGPLQDATTLTTGEDPRVFVHAGKVHVQDNTLDGCRLIVFDTQKGARRRVYRVALSGKNFTFLPAPSDEGGAANELLLVHWFVPLRVYRVGLPEDQPTESFATLECIYAEGEGSSSGSGLDPEGRERPRALDAVPGDQLRGGTPGRAAGPGVWWGVLHRTHHLPGGVLRHDPFSWVLRRFGASTFSVHLAPVETRGRPPTSNILDPCCIVEGTSESGNGTPLFATTAESESGWFSEQAFVTGVWQLSISAQKEP